MHCPNGHGSKALAGGSKAADSSARHTPSPYDMSAYDKSCRRMHKGASHGKTSSRVSLVTPVQHMLLDAAQHQFKGHEQEPRAQAQQAARRSIASATRPGSGDKAQVYVTDRSFLC